MSSETKMLHYWIFTHDQGQNLTLLQDDTLTLIDTIKRKVVQETIESLMAGGPLPEKAAKTATNYPVTDISKLEYVEGSTTVKFHYTAGEKPKKGEINADEKEQAAEAMQIVTGALGPKVHQEIAPLPVWQSVLTPGLVSLGMIAGTVICYLAVSDIDAGEDYNPVGRRSGMKKLVRNALLSLGENGVFLIGTLLTAGALAWTVRRFMVPPEQTVVERQS